MANNKMDTGNAENIPFSSTWVPSIGFGVTRDFKNDIMDSKLEIHSKKHNEYISTLLCSSKPANRENIEKLLSINMKFSDFGCLSDGDLQLIGIKNKNNRQEILNDLKELPDQTPSLEDIYKQPIAQQYNERILMNAANHIHAMWLALAGANSQMIATPAEDDLLGEKYYASRFMLNSLAELKTGTNDILKELAELEKVINTKNMKNKKANLSKRHYRSWILITSVICISLPLLWFWKFKYIFS